MLVQIGWHRNVWSQCYKYTYYQYLKPFVTYRVYRDLRLHGYYGPISSA